MKFILLIITIISAAACLIAVYFHINHNDNKPITDPGYKIYKPKIINLTNNYAVPVLMYHRIDDLGSDEVKSPLLRDLTVPVKDFDEQIKYLVEQDFAVLSIRDVENAQLNNLPLPKKSVVITMDDGYRDNFENAFPILQKYGIPATIFVVTSMIDKSNHLSWDQILQMNNKPVNYGSHTIHHYDLTTLPLTKLDDELILSKQTLENKLPEKITSIAYPSGEFNDLVTQRTKQAGYISGWKKGGGPVQPGNNMYLLPRIRVHGRTTMEDFKRKVWSGVYAQL